MRDYELIRCAECRHERVRPRVEGQFYMHCMVCGSREQEVFDLVAVDRDDTDAYLPTEEGLAYFAEVYDHAAA